MEAKNVNARITYIQDDKQFFAFYEHAPNTLPDTITCKNNDVEVYIKL